MDTDDDIFGPQIEQRKYADFTEGMKRHFLEHLATTGNVRLAIESLRLCRASVYGERRQNPEFRAQWDEAHALGIEAMEDEASRRAFHGYLEPVYYLGNVVGHVRKFSDGLAQFILRGAKPEKYRERYEVDGTLTLENELKGMSDAELRAKILHGLQYVGVSIRQPQTFEHEPAASDGDGAGDDEVLQLPKLDF